MIAPSTIIAALMAALPAAQVTAVDRLNAAARPFDTGRASMVWLTVLAGLVVATAVVALGWSLANRKVRRRQAAQFGTYAERTGLSDAERRLLVSIARSAGLKRIDSVFTMASAFQRGVERLLGGERLSRLPEPRREELVAMLDRVRDKLGFASPGERRGDAGLGRIPPAAVAHVFRRGLADYFDATVVKQGPGEKDLLIRPDAPILAEAGETWELRYGEGSLLWEVTGVVVRPREGAVQLSLSGGARSINLRRFPRVQTNKPAFAACFPFISTGADGAPPAFVSATLTEIGGPGLRLDAPLHTAVGEKVLVGVQFGPRRVIQGLAIVRRVTGADDGMTTIAAEIVGLSTSEVSELIRETNTASQTRQVDNRAEKVAVAQES